MPNRRQPDRITAALRILATIALSALLVYGTLSFLGRIQTTVVILIASTFLAYLIYPVVRILNRRLPMLLSILIVYAVIILFLALVVAYLLPPLIIDGAAFAKSFPKLISDLSHAIQDPHNPVFGWMPQLVRDYLATLPAQLGSLAQNYGFNAAQQVLLYLLSAVSVAAGLIIIPILTAYIMLDAENLLLTVLGLFSGENRPKAKAILADLDRVLGGFIRGQILDGVIVGALVFVALLILRVPYAYLIAVAAGILNFVPYLGAVIGFIPSVILAFVYNGPTNALMVGVTFAAIQQLDGNVIVPRIMKENVGLSPVWIIVSIITFSELFGILGTFVAVPVAAMLRILKMHFLPEPVPVEEKELLPEEEELRVDTVPDAK